MPAIYCLDTDVLIDLMRGTSSVVEHLAELPDDARLCITHIAAYELLRGVCTVGQPDQLQRVLHFIAQFECVGQSIAADLLAAKWWAKLRAHGTHLPDADLIIAAVAATAHATLVTRNRKHFARLPDLLVDYW